VANAGALVTIAGAGFGSAASTVSFAVGSSKQAAKVTHWSNDEITVVVPPVGAGAAQVTITRGAASSNPAPFRATAGKLIPVNFFVSGVPPHGAGDEVMLTGSLAELGNWSTTWNGAEGPAVIPSGGNALLTVSVPAGVKAEFKFFILHAD
jgi:hypothetical protein